MSLKFAIGADRFDQSTYAGRLQHFLNVIDPRTLARSEQEVADAQALIASFKAAGEVLAPGVTDADMWAAKKTVDAVIHPMTGQPIDPIYRISGFVPMNIPIIAGMLMSTSLPMTLWWQFYNQSYNSAMNYANRSGAEMPVEEIAKGYGLAVGVAMSSALGFRKMAENAPKALRGVAQSPWAVPYLAVAVAGSSNVYFTRRPECWDTGVPVTDKAGNQLGMSKKAGQHGVLLTILSRSILLPLPLLTVPPAIMSLVRPHIKNKRMLLLAELGAVTVALGGAVPATIALFPQTVELAGSSLEPEFHKHPRVYSNKGL